MASFTVDVVSAERKILSVEAVGLYVTTTVGSLGILPGHQPVLAGLSSGEAHLELTDGSTTYLAVHRGYLYYSGGDTAVILADLAEVSTDIDLASEKAKLAAAEAGSNEADLAAAKVKAAERAA